MGSDFVHAVMWAGSWGLGSSVVIVVVLEFVELFQMRPRPARGVGFPATGPTERPFVSVHVPTHDEPPEVVLRTLQALRRQNYDRYEVVVLDNNTLDPNLWRPLQHYCESNSDVFRFVHRTGVVGFKAGALNLALAETNPDADFVAVVDADYETEPEFVEHLVAAADERISFVQAPQAYRTDGLVRWQRWAVAEYRRFFAVGMRIRARHNALHLHGTVVLVRRADLLASGGWEIRCVTEDCELGLRLLASGAVGEYLDEPVGYGLVPLRFADYAAQRRRWVTGAVQTIRLHSRSLLIGRGPHGHLSLFQRLCYFQGWLPWVRDCLVFAGGSAVFVGAAVVGLFPMLRAPLQTLAGLILAGLALAAAKESLVLVRHVGTTPRQTIGALAVIVALIPTTASAWLRGWRTDSVAFRRTPKSRLFLVAEADGSTRDASIAVVAFLVPVMQMWAGTYSAAVHLVTAGVCGVGLLRWTLRRQPLPPVPDTEPTVSVGPVSGT